jgi:hypothetical protein
MKYTIVDIGPGKIKVEFEDGSWAQVPIEPNATPEEVDNAVSNYDPDFLQRRNNLINQNISLNEKRVSTRIENHSSQISNPLSDANFKIPTTTISQLSFGAANPITILALSKYFAERGDNRIKDALEKNIEDFINSSDFSLEKIINDLQDDAYEIYRLALVELESTNNGISST